MSSTSQIGQGFYHIGRKLSELGQSMNGPHCPGKITVDGKVIAELVPLGGYRRPGMTKAKRVSFCGLFEGKRVKVYGTYSADHTKLRLSLESTGLGRQFFPRLIASDKTHIVEEWIDGVPLKKVESSLFERAAGEFQRFLYECRNREELIRLAANHAGAFCYFHDYLVKRLDPWCVLDFVRQFVRSWQDAYDRVKDKIEVRLSHPDLSAANILLEKKSGRFVVIDNELLGAGRGWILDRRNSFLKDSAGGWENFSDSGLDKGFVSESWRLRLLGSALDAADFERAYTVATEPDSAV